MTSSSRNFNLLKSPWTKTFDRLISLVEDNLMLISPFIKQSETTKILSQLKKRGIHDNVRVVVLTDLRPERTLNGSTDLEAFVELGNNLPQFDLIHLPGLHAKVYVADRSMAIITSGNLTDAGIKRNLEYGVAITDESVVAEIRNDFENYKLLGGAKITSEALADLLDEVRKLKDLSKKAEKAEKAILAQVRRAFNKKLEAIHVQLLRHRLKGKTMNAILAETILFLLAKGPLRTFELHPSIQGLHPDICDDSVDRIIDGVHFGKKWKHYVRNAQQYLKEKNRIRYDGERWHLMS